MGCPTNERFVTIHAGSRIWAVGAIHGEAAKLSGLHAALEERFRPGDRIVYLGNYLGVGAEVAAALDELIAFRGALLAVPHMQVCDVVYLRGSQEEMWQKLLQLHLSVEPASVLRWMLGRGVRETLAAYGWEAGEAEEPGRATGPRRSRAGPTRCGPEWNAIRGIGSCWRACGRRPSPTTARCSS